MTPFNVKEIENLKAKAEAAIENGHTPDSWWNFSRDYNSEFGKVSAAYLDASSPQKILSLISYIAQLRLRAEAAEKESDRGVYERGMMRD